MVAPPVATTVVAAPQVLVTQTQAADDVITLNIPNEAHFGDDGPLNYAAFVNNGTINAGGGETKEEGGGCDGRHDRGAAGPAIRRRARRHRAA